MAAHDARVLLVAPVSQFQYFDAEGKHSIAWYAKRALRVARTFSPKIGVDVFLYGKKEGEDGVSAIHSELTHDGLGEWVRNWATRPNGDLGLLDEPGPRNPLEEFFGIAPDRARARPLGAFDEVCRWTESLDGYKLVIFWVELNVECDDMIRKIARQDRPDIFWQFFGHDLSYSFWRKDGLMQGKLVPNVGAKAGSYWNRRSITRGFRRWRSSAG